MKKSELITLLNKFEGDPKVTIPIRDKAGNIIAYKQLLAVASRVNRNDRLQYIDIII